ncbi:AAA family ATPase [Afipia carboxidovorans]|uniref:AAA family ATPase n=1 Tax=Afipia carboxidovorans TaxID=40137 RepID=UPI00308CF7E1|nr:AAA family ATPase [Afipia carboxidovorans]
MITELDSEQRESAKKQAATEKIIKTACPAVTDVKRYVEAEVPSDLESKIASAGRSLELARHSAAVKATKDPLVVSLRPATDFEDIARKTIKDVSDASIQKIAQHIKSHSMDQNGHRWLKYGVEHTVGSICPFCTQDTSEIEIVSIFKGYFSEEFSSLTSEIESAAQELSAVYGDAGEKLLDVIEQNDVDFLFWEKVCDLVSVPSLSEEQKQSIVASLKTLKEMIVEKTSHPLSSHDLGVNREKIVSDLRSFAQYQESVLACTKIIQAARSEVASVDVSKSEEALSKYKALKARLNEPVKSEVLAWASLAKRRSEIEVEKGQAQEKLRSHMASTIDGRQKAINDLLEMFGASFRIANTKASFLGREASTDFSVAIGSHAIKAGQSSDNEPSFATVLSGGDKFTLALAFFITQVRADSNIGAARIIFDDPFNSQDTQRQWETSSQIRALASESCQVIVLSHDPRFLALIEKNASSCSLFQMVCDDEGNGSIRQWSSADELKEIYVRQAERIREYATKGNMLPSCTAENLIKDLRPFLEDFIRARFPGRFDPLIMLDEMTNQIEAAGPDDPFHKHVAEFRAINEYSRDNMHAGASVPDPGQLRAQCKRINKIIGSY